MALFSDDEDYQDDQGQNQQPLNTLDHIDSSRNLYNNIKNKQGSSAAGSAGSQAAAKGSATDSSGKATTAPQGIAQKAAKRPSKLRAVSPKNPALQPELLQEMLRLPLLPPLQFLY